MSAEIHTIQSILDIETLEHNLFRGRSPSTSWQRVFGGQVIAQALVAAQRTVGEDRFVHSLHGYFMLGGDPSIPIIYEVERLRDGGSFTTRRVTAIQHGKAIFSLEASFQVDEPGLEHQSPMPVVPMPEDLLGQAELIERYESVMPEGIARYWRRERPIMIKPVALEHYTSREKLDPVQNNWVKFRETVPSDRHVRAALLAYMSDMTLLDTSTFPHGRAVFDSDLQVASLDHAMWFHRDDPLDDWLLYSQDSPWSGGARGFTRGSLFTRNGVLIASVAQEGLVRVRTEQKK
jgi:acyl-CoA thioesterase-2